VGGEVIVDAVRLVFGAELRRRWRSWLILVVLIAIVGGLVLAAAAAGRRTATAFPRFVASHGYDVYIFNQKPVPGLSRLPGVSSVTTIGDPASGQPTCTCTTRAINPSNFYINEMTPPALRRVVKLVAGQMPAASSPYDVLASFTLQQDYGVQIGSVIRTPLYASSQLPALERGAGKLTPSGPTVALRVVGIGAAEMEFPSGTTPEYDLFTTPAFARVVNKRVPRASVYLVRLREGTTSLPRLAAAVGSLHVDYVSNQATAAAAVAASIHPQAVGWWVLAVLAALAGLAVVGQALSRQSVVESEDYPSLVAVGLLRRQLVALGTARNLMVALVGAAGAILVAFALSPLTPVGEARLAEPSTGLAFDPLVLLLGALGTVVVVLFLGIWPTVRAAQAGGGGKRASGNHPSSVVAKVAAIGAPPSAVIGVRHALERGRGTASVPVGTALFGSVLAVAALCATVVFADSLTHLTSTPVLYGSNYQLSFSTSNGGPGNPTSWVSSLERDRSISAIMLAATPEVSIKGHDVLAFVGKAVRGPLLLSTVDGRLPTGDHDMTLGATTLHQVGAHVGSVLEVTLQLPTGGTRSVPFHVVGTASFPSDAGGGLGTGSAFTLAGYLDAACPLGRAEAECRQAFTANQNFLVLAKATSGPKGQAAIARYVTQDRATRPTIPTSLVNFGEAVNFPLILGFVLAVFGVATLLHLLVVSVVRRRREMGLLKAIGFVNRQVGATVLWQASTVALVGVVIGIPLGIVVGRVVWNAFATNLGAVPVAAVPVLAIAVVAIAVFVVANALAVLPALTAARRQSVGQLLRTE
jgi:ABC-type lipoprotein release transport system permease subunit